MFFTFTFTKTNAFVKITISEANAFVNNYFELIEQILNKKKEGVNMRIDRKKLVIKMIDKNVNVQELASVCGISRVTASNVKCGKSCSKETVQKIAKGLGCKLTDLLEVPEHHNKGGVKHE